MASGLSSRKVSTPLWHMIRQRVFASLLFRIARKHDQLTAERKRNLFAGLSGTVVEIGPGTGVNLAHYPHDIDWIGVEPNIFMHDYLLDETRRFGFEYNVRQQSAEHLDFLDESVDAVVSTLVLCSVADPQRVLSEVVRILKPNGLLAFMEHVAGPEGSLLRFCQWLARPACRCFADGCCPDRETLVLIGRAGFESVSAEQFSFPVPVLSPHVIGIARKKQAR